MNYYLIFETDPETTDQSFDEVLADDFEEAAYEYALDNTSEGGDELELWAQEVKSGITKRFRCVRTFSETHLHLETNIEVEEIV